MQLKPPVSAQLCLSGSGSSRGSGCLQQAPPASAPAGAAQRQHHAGHDDQSIVSRLEFSGSEIPFEFVDDEERKTSDPDHAGEAGDQGRDVPAEHGGPGDAAVEADPKLKVKARRVPPLLSANLRDQCGRLIAVAWPSDADGLQPLTSLRAVDQRNVSWVFHMAYKLAQKAVALVTWW